MDRMFCFQCEQTVGCSGCTGHAGACGKTAEVANLQDALTGSLISLALHTEMPTDEQRALAAEALFATVTNVDFSAAAVGALIDRVREQHEGPAYDMKLIWDADEDTRSLKSLVLFGIRGMAAYAHHARVLGYASSDIDLFLFEALAAIARTDDAGMLLSLALRTGEMNLACMELLDEANTRTYGNPQPTTVELGIDPGPFIIVTGHDLLDLQLLLEQTDGRGVNVYTHGEMLPACAYPELAKHPQLKGNFGTAWQNQREEFDGVPAPILFTTNCLMPPRAGYADRVYTSGMVAYDGTRRISDDKDFAPLIEHALSLGGYPARQGQSGINGGTSVTTGFGRHTVLSVAGDIVDAVKSGEISRFFLVGGCDGARPGRNYFTEFVEKTPADSVVLTLACGKYRFNDLDLGTVAGLPRLLDMGQCNDAYGAIQVAIALSRAFDCDIDELPLSMVLSWYEQKAVCILLTLLHLGIKNIHLGPTLPPFISPGILNLLVEEYGIAPTTTPEADLEKLLG